MEEKLLDIAEVARYLNLSEESVRELVEKGDLPAYKIGGVLLRFKKGQIEDYCKRRDSTFIVEKAALLNKGVKREFTSIGTDKRLNVSRERLWIDRKNVSGPSEVRYTFLERLEDFLYYNDFYILSLILLALIVLAVFGF